MELCSFWVINPADGQEGKPEPVKLRFFENGDIELISLCEDPEYRGAYKLPCGSYQYTGDSLKVYGENLGRIRTLARGDVSEAEYRAGLFSVGLLNEREWDLFYANPASWKSLRIVVIAFGDE